MLYTSSTEDVLEVIYSGDPAIDPKASDMESYYKDHNEDHLVLIGTPTRFTISGLTSMEAARATRYGASQMAETGGNDEAYRNMTVLLSYFRAGVRKITDLKKEGDEYIINPKRGMMDVVFNMLPRSMAQPIASEIGMLVFILTQPVDTDSLEPGDDEGK